MVSRFGGPLRAVPAAGATAVRLEGRALEGALMLPAADGAALAGKFERLHWRAPASAARRGTAAGSPAAETRKDGAMGELAILFMPDRPEQWPTVDPSHPDVATDLRGLEAYQVH